MLEGMKWATQAFSLPAEKQKEFFFRSTNIATELGTEWDFALGELDRPEAASILTKEKKAAFKVLDDYLNELFELNYPQYWNNESFYQSEKWEEVRKLATNILNVMDWKHELEPEENVTIIYIDEEE